MGTNGGKGRLSAGEEFAACTYKAYPGLVYSELRSRQPTWKQPAIIMSIHKRPDPVAGAWSCLLAVKTMVR
jgi:hypothetical protein